MTSIKIHTQIHQRQENSATLLLHCLEVRASFEYNFLAYQSEWESRQVVDWCIAHGQSQLRA